MPVNPLPGIEADGSWELAAMRGVRVSERGLCLYIHRCTHLHIERYTHAHKYSYTKGSRKPLFFSDYDIPMSPH